MPGTVDARTGSRLRVILARLASSGRPLLAAALLAAVAVLAVPAPAHAAEVGYPGPSFSGANDPTAEKPQSKLWFNDGLWWSSMYTPSVKAFTVHRLDWATQTWADTGVVIEDRRQAKMDVLWDGSKLFVASAGPSSASADSGRLYRFSYLAASQRYVLDAGFPVTPINGGMEAIVMDRDTAGTVWITYTRNNTVFVTHSTTSEAAWTNPYPLPVPGATNLSSDDISATIAFDGRIGVMWGNQTEESYYFAVHVDGAEDDVWTREVAYSRPEGADDHISLKSIQNDPEGRIFAIVKTSLNDSDDPLNVVLVRKRGGQWDTDNVFGRVRDAETRAILVIDGENNDVYGFAAAPEYVGGTIYMKKVSVNALLNGNPFRNGLGEVFIESAQAPRINNPTSTKQSVDSSMDLVVLASDWYSRTYQHNKVDIGPPDDVPPETTIGTGPSGTETTDSAAITFSANESGSTFECRLDAGSWAPCSSPHQLSQLSAGPHAFDVRATDPSGNTDASPARRTWIVDVEVDTRIDDGPVGTVGQTSASFTFSANAANASFDCRLDGAAWSPCTTPHQLSGLENGSHVFEVRATVAGGTDASPAARTWTVDSSVPIRLLPDADGTVRAGTPGANEGLSLALRADSSPSEQSFARFTVSGVPAGESVTSATLRMRATNGSGNGPEIYPSATSWSEDAVTWNSRPALTGPLVADIGAVAVGAWAEYDVTERVTGNGSYSFGVIPDSSDGTVFSSREGADAPELIIQTGTVDTTAPDTAITAGPSGTTTTGSATFDFTSNEPGARFECRLDEGAWADCTPPHSLPALTNGSHDVAVRAIDLAGNVDPTPATRTWTVAIPLETTIETGPTGTIGSASATFSFSANSPTAGFECAVDAEPWQSCASPYTWSATTDGQHTFQARAVENGDVDPTPATRGWTLDTTLPIRATPDADAMVRQDFPTTTYGGGQTLEADTSPIKRAFARFDVAGVAAGREVTSATLRFDTTNGSGNGPKVYLADTNWDESTVTWNTRPGTVGAAVADVGSVPAGEWLEYDVTSAVSGNGTYAFGIVPDSSDGVVLTSREGGNPPELVLRTAVPDVAAPETVIDSGPSGTTTVDSAIFEFSADETGSTFECRLDGASWQACTSPHDLAGLSSAAHTFDVRATDRSGNTDATPASRTWAVEVPLETTLDTGPTGTVPATTATFTFSATSPAAAFECRLDGGGWEFCSSPRQVTGLAEGAHTFEVRAVDGDQPDPTPAVRSWTVDSSLPIVLEPKSDATVRQASPTTNYGGTSRLEADTSPVESAYLTFTLDGVGAGSVRSAVLRLQASNGSGNGPRIFAADNGWSEDTVSWDTRPATSGGALADVAGLPVDQWVEYDVSSGVVGDGTYTFAVVPDSSDGVVFSSREGAQPPHLVVETGAPDVTAPSTTVDSGPTGTVGSTSATFAFSADEPGATFECRLDGGPWSSCTSPARPSGLSEGEHVFDVRATDPAGNTDPTPATRTWTVNTTQPATLRFAPVRDARVVSTKPAANFGFATSLVADGSPTTRSFLAFDVQGLTGSVESAVLRVYVTNGTGNGPTVEAVTSPWSEGGVTWAAQPSTSESVLADAGAVGVDTWLELDVTDAVSGEGLVDLALLPESSDGLFARSREASVNPPELVVTTTP